MDTFGGHALSCSSSIDRIARHNDTRDLVFQTCRSAGVSPVLEAKGLPETSRRRTGHIFISNWAHRSSTAVALVPSVFCFCRDCRGLTPFMMDVNYGPYECTPLTIFAIFVTISTISYSALWIKPFSDTSEEFYKLVAHHQIILKQILPKQCNQKRSLQR